MENLSVHSHARDLEPALLFSSWSLPNHQIGETSDKPPPDEGQLEKSLKGAGLDLNTPFES